jgi:8-oxo-dGTP pyrophosphatase MutT (NUDIX family)
MAPAKDTIHSLLDRSKATLSAAGILAIDGQFIFAVQTPSRWRPDESGRPIIAFGGIGGKVEAAETVTEGLRREFREEVAIEVALLSNPNPIGLITPERGVEIIDATGPHEIEALPAFIFVNPKAEKDQTRDTHVFAFLCKRQSGALTPIDNPAFVAITEDLLRQIVGERLTVGEAKHLGATITSSIELPLNSQLFPTPTPRGVILYLDALSASQKETFRQVLRQP